MDEMLRVRLVGDDSGLTAVVTNASQRIDRFGQSGTAASRAVAEGMRETQRSVQAVHDQIAATRNLLIGFFSIQYAGEAAGAVVQLADDMARLEARLKLVSRSQQEFNIAQRELDLISTNARAPLQDTVSLYTRLAPSIQEAGRSQQDALAVTEAVVQATKLSGTSAQSAAAGIQQFSQAIGSGVLRGDEFNSVMESAPRLAQALADGLGRPRGELRALAEQGRLTSEVVINALLSQKEKLASEFSQLPVTVDDSLNLIKKNWAQMVHEFNQSTGATAGIADMLGTLAENMDTVAAAAGVVASVLAGRGVAALATYGERLVERSRDLLANRAAAVANAEALMVQHRALTAVYSATVQAGVANGAYIASLRAQVAESAAATAAARTHAASLSLVTRAMAVLGGPAGLIATAATALGIWALTARDAKSEADALAESAGNLAGGMRAAADVNFTKNYTIADELVKLNVQYKAQIMAVNAAQEAAAKGNANAARALDDYRASASKTLKEIKSLEDQLTKLNTATAGAGPAPAPKPKGESEAAKAAREHQRALDGVNAALADQYAKLVLTEREYAQYQLAQKGLTAAEQDAAMQLWDMNHALEEQQAQLKGASAEAREFQALMDDLFPNEAQARKFVEQWSVLQREMAKGKMSPEQFGIAEGALMGKFGDTPGPAGASNDQSAQALERLREQLASEEELIQQSYMNRGLVVADALSQRIVTEEQAQALMREITLRHLAEQGNAEAKAVLWKDEFDKANFTKKTQMMTSHWQTLLAGSQQHSRAMFEINKALAIANGLVSLPQTVMEAYEWGVSWGGPPAGAAAAAVAGAAQLINLNAIRSAEFAGNARSAGGTVGAVPISPGTGLPVEPLRSPATAQQQAPAQPTVNVYVNGSIVDHAAFARELRPYIVQAENDRT